MATISHPSMSTRQALDLLSVDHHTYDMRLKFQECFVCGAPVNFMRLYNEHKKYCPRHDDASGDLAAAIEALNAPAAARD